MTRARSAKSTLLAGFTAVLLAVGITMSFAADQTQTKSLQVMDTFDRAVATYDGAIWHVTAYVTREVARGERIMQFDITPGTGVKTALEAVKTRALQLAAEEE